MPKKQDREKQQVIRGKGVSLMENEKIKDFVPCGCGKDIAIYYPDNHILCNCGLLIMGEWVFKVGEANFIVTNRSEIA